jgi:hypothetical protein
MKMKFQSALAAILCCVLAGVAFAAETGLEGTWNTDGVAGYQAAVKAKKSTSGLPEATQIKLKVDTKKGKVTGTVSALNIDKEFDVVDGKLEGTTFTFGAVPATALSFGGNNNGGNFNGAGNNNNQNQNQAKPILWKGELKDADTISLQRVDETGNPMKTADGAVMGAVLFHRAKK